MSLFSRIFGRALDPAIDWSPFEPPIPDLDVSTMSFGPLKFGDRLEEASFLGRPERFVWKQGTDCELLYASGGFLMEFSEGKFGYLAFFIGPDEWLPKEEPVSFCSPHVCGAVPDGTQLSGDIEQAALEHLFGPADSRDVDPDEISLFYSRQKVTMEFELNGRTGKLKRWNLYPDSSSSG